MIKLNAIIRTTLYVGQTNEAQTAVVVVKVSTRQAHEATSGIKAYLQDAVFDAAWLLAVT
jgi:hypothetical protein